MRLAAYIFAIAVYLTVTIPSLRTIVTPADVDTRGDRIEAMQILAAGNSIMMITLGAILVFQVSRLIHLVLYLTWFVFRVAKSTHAGQRLES